MSKEKIIEQKNENTQIEPKIDNQKQEELKEVENSLEKFTQNIKKYLLEVQKGEDKSALFLLLMASCRIKKQASVAYLAT